MYTGGEFVKEINGYKKDANVFKHKITFKTHGWRGGRWGGKSTDTKPNAVYMLPCLYIDFCVNSLNAELNPIRHLLALVGARHIV
jgi:hypothetical protein